MKKLLGIAALVATMIIPVEAASCYTTTLGNSTTTRCSDGTFINKYKNGNSTLINGRVKEKTLTGTSRTIGKSTYSTIRTSSGKTYNHTRRSN